MISVNRVTPLSLKLILLFDSHKIFIFPHACFTFKEEINKSYSEKSFILLSCIFFEKTKSYLLLFESNNIK